MIRRGGSLLSIRQSGAWVVGLNPILCVICSLNSRYLIKDRPQHLWPRQISPHRGRKLNTFLPRPSGQMATGLPTYTAKRAGVWYCSSSSACFLSPSVSLPHPDQHYLYGSSGDRSNHRTGGARVFGLGREYDAVYTEQVLYF